jgi:hypothetical protein
MGHYAKVENGVVTQVIVADGPDWCEQNLGGEWVQTSYNTSGGVHSGGKFPIHKNYAGIGYLFDGIGFYSPQPYPSWTKDEATYLWNAPVAMPTDGKAYSWNEETLSWDELELPTE